MAVGGKVIRMEVKGLMMDPSNVPIVILRSEDPAKILPIWIGIFEANAIAITLEGADTPRPMTHDLAIDLLESLEARILRIIVSDLSDNTYFAQIVIDSDDGERIVDSRPSDAIALALRSEAPIFVAESVLEQASTNERAETIRDDDELKKWLEEVDPDDLGKYTM